MTKKKNVLTRQEFKNSDLEEKVGFYEKPFYWKKTTTHDVPPNYFGPALAFHDDKPNIGYMPWSSKYYDGVIAYDCNKCEGIVLGRPRFKMGRYDDFELLCRNRTCNNVIKRYVIVDY